MPKPSPVLFIDSRADAKERNSTKYGRLLAKLNLGEIIEEGDLVAIKLSFGERGNLTYIRPQYVRPVVDEIKRLGGRPFLTDSNTLYPGGRQNSRDHVITAIENGFDFGVTGAPIVIAGGLLGLDYRSVPVKGDYFQEAKIVPEAVDADAIVALSHFKGHMISGFGGAIKNVGMGLGARAGKQAMHSDVRPSVEPSQCTACAKCIEWCPEDAISLKQVHGEKRKKALIEAEACVGCGECVAVCFTGAIGISWETDPAKMQERMAEYALAVLQDKKNKFAAINYLLDVTPDCDCLGWSDNPIVPNIGIAASYDPVAADAASLDLVGQAHGIGLSALPSEKLGSADKFGSIHKGIDGKAQLAHAEKLGLGSRNYGLVDLNKS